MPKSTKVVKRTPPKAKPSSQQSAKPRAQDAQRSTPSARRAEPAIRRWRRRRRCKPRSARGNAAAAEKFLARDFSFIDAAGHVHSRRERAQCAARRARAAPGTQVKVRDYGRVALITGSYKSAQAGERSDLFALDVWVKDDKQVAGADPSQQRAGAAGCTDGACVGGAAADGCAAAALREPAGGRAVQAEIAGRARHHRGVPGAGAGGHAQRSRTNGRTTSPTSSWSPARASIRPTRPRAWRSWRRSGRSTPRPSSPRWSR